MYNQPVVSALPTDSEDYHLLVRGVELSANVPGMTCEIGLRAGGGSALIIETLARVAPHKTHIAIDPYGSILYEHKEKDFVRLDYTNDMRDECLSRLYQYCKAQRVNFQFFNLTDLDFFEKYWDGIVTYDMERVVNMQYSFIHFDGPHAVEALKTEITFFLDANRIHPGACWCFDDVTGYYDHSIIDSYLARHGFTLIDITKCKALYQYAPKN